MVHRHNDSTWLKAFNPERRTIGEMRQKRNGSVTLTGMRRDALQRWQISGGCRPQSKSTRHHVTSRFTTSLNESIRQEAIRMVNRRYYE